MKLNKTLIASAITATITVPAAGIADTIEITFTGAFSLIGGTGNINGNSDAVVAGEFSGTTGFDGIGSRTPISGTATFDTTTKIGSGTIDPFSFFGNGLASSSAVSFQAIGDGMGSTMGTLIAATLGFDQGFSFGTPVAMVLDAEGFFNSIQGPESTWTVGANCAGCATSATPDTLFGHAVGAIPIAMTTFNTAGITLGSLFPLSDDGIAGSPMTTAPFPGQNFAFDFTTINATNISAVPIPATAWLFTSGLVGLASIARRRRR